jgi:hypothetical protein
MKTSEFLKKAKEKILDPSHWCSGVYAEDNAGNSIDVKSPKATRWCAYGAIDSMDVVDTYADRILSNSSIRLYHMELASVNDSLGHEAVIKIYDAAIATAKMTEKRVLQLR